MAGSISGGRVHDRVQILLQNTGGRRCRLQALNDASIHYGWVKDYSNGSIEIEISSKRDTRNGDFLYLEVHGQMSMLVFVAYITKATPEIITLTISSEVEERPIKTESRKRSTELTGYLDFNNTKSPIVVRDVSENGLGFITEKAIERGACTAVIKSPFGDVLVPAEVRHVQLDKEGNCYRGGLLIKEFDRVSKARWIRVVSEQGG